MKDDLATRLSCVKCDGFRFELGTGDDTICQECGTIMVYWKGRYVLKTPDGFKEPKEAEAYEAGFLAGLHANSE